MLSIVAQKFAYLVGMSAGASDGGAYDGLPTHKSECHRSLSEIPESAAYTRIVRRSQHL